MKHRQSGTYPQNFQILDKKKTAPTPEKEPERKKETVDRDGNTEAAIYPSDYTWTKTGTENVYQGIDQAKLVPLLVKTIQELEARIKALEDA